MSVIADISVPHQKLVFNPDGHVDWVKTSAYDSNDLQLIGTYTSVDDAIAKLVAMESDLHNQVLRECQSNGITQRAVDLRQQWFNCRATLTKVRLQKNPPPPSAEPDLERHRREVPFLVSKTRKAFDKNKLPSTVAADSKSAATTKRIYVTELSSRAIRKMCKQALLLKDDKWRDFCSLVEIHPSQRNLFVDFASKNWDQKDDLVYFQHHEFFVRVKSSLSEVLEA